MQSFLSNSPVTFYLIAASALLSLVALYLYPPLLETGFLKPYRTVRRNTWYELVTSGFLHGSLGHLFVNLFTLYFFGRIMEEVMGAEHFLGLYLSGLVVSGIPSLLKYRNDPGYATLGASGAVGAVLFAFIFLFPMENIYLLIFPVPIPAFVFGALYLVYSMYASKQERGNINHEAHLAGSVWGIIYLVLFVPEAISRFMAMLGI